MNPAGLARGVVVPPMGLVRLDPASLARAVLQLDGHPGTQGQQPAPGGGMERRKGAPPAAASLPWEMSAVLNWTGLLSRPLSGAHAGTPEARQPQLAGLPWHLLMGAAAANGAAPSTAELAAGRRPRS